eukprot:CAMPEP_0197518530 /NCGR_PEP_ID=MMETSP1318-20131121/3735_1 /TAXON_ID=552666 /ORGANISM="Partenskyella glossopodia, Strain RCC365" /LENGTH=165 /DNA_ID=CAMNT_0043068939 /DNA_START=169 /DNA_END=666 /DNA_ORIENTATION=-
MPVTSSNFQDLAKTGFYDGLHFHRVIQGFMIQFGCPHSADPDSPMCGTGGPENGSSFKVGDETVTRNNGGCVPDEFAEKISNMPLTLSMANTGRPDSGGSQFFINTNPSGNEFLDFWRDDLAPSKHPVFGEVFEGEDVVTAIEQTQTAPGDRPVTPVKMISITIE